MKRIVIPFVIVSTLFLSACGFNSCGGGCGTATYVETRAPACCPVATTCNTCGYGGGYSWY
jgi:hypothetical protein